MRTNPPDEVETCYAVVLLFLFIIYFPYLLSFDWRYNKVPHFKIEELAIAGLEESLASSRLNTVSTLTIVTRNGADKMDVDYKGFSVQVETKELGIIIVGGGSVDEFHCVSNNESTFGGSFSTSADEAIDEEQRRALEQGRLMLIVRLASRTHYTYGRWKWNSGNSDFEAKVECEVDIDPRIFQGSQIVWSEPCKVTQFNCLVEHCRHGKPGGISGKPRAPGSGENLNTAHFATE